MSHIPEDRQARPGPDYTLEQNLVLQRYWNPEFHNHGMIKFDAVRQYAEKLIGQYDIRSGQGPVTIARSMSGGNQQKAIVAREIDKAHKLLVAVQPTRAWTWAPLSTFTASWWRSGTPAQLCSWSPGLDEVMNLSDRILVMYEGEIVGEFDPKTVDVQELGLYMAGAKRMEDIPHEKQPACGTTPVF